jgi:predicted nucleic acid-binding protein
VFISLFTKVEMKSLLARRTSLGQLSAEDQSRVLATFDGDIAAGHLVLVPHTVESFLLAEALLGAHPGIPLRTLDALHLAAMSSYGVAALATADRVMAGEARGRGARREPAFPRPTGRPPKNDTSPPE